MNANEATLSELAEELNRANIALAIGLSRKEERKWRRYRKQVHAELMQRTAPSHDSRPMTDAELKAELSSES